MSRSVIPVPSLECIPRLKSEAMLDNRVVISVCVSVKNRCRVQHGDKTLELFPNCVRSLANAAKQLNLGAVELIIVDYHSDDWPIKEWIDGASNGLRVQILHHAGDFSRGQGLNMAAAAANSNCLFLMDADMLVCEDLLRRGIEVVTAGLVFFPICRDLNEAGKPRKWRRTGFGNAFVSSTLFCQIEGIPQFRSWGGEDNVFLERVVARTSIVRERCSGFFHQWHPHQCRHANYANPRRFDQRRFFRKHKAKLGARYFVGIHPKWQGKLLLFPNGRMSRPGGDCGTFEMKEHRQLILNWDYWPSETLYWDSVSGQWHSTCGFTLREMDS